MSQFAILRVQKLKAAVAVQRSAKHNYREQDTPNADPDRTPDNTHHGPQNVQELMQAFEDRKPAKHRKDAVQCVEVLITASPEAMHAKTKAQQDAYFADSLDWLKSKFGEQNVIGASIHRDEATPHLAAYVVPVDPDSGRLNAKRWLGGSGKLSELQTDFAAGVGKAHGLERGTERSKATHKAVRQWYAELGDIERTAARAATVTVDELKPRKLKGETLAEKVFGAKETDEGVAQRLTDRFAPIVAKADQVHRKNRELDAEARKLRQQNRSLMDRFGDVVDLLKGLTSQQLIAVKLYAAQLRDGNKQEQEQKRVRQGGLGANWTPRTPGSRRGR